MRRRKRKCPHCKEFFFPHRSVADRQKYCSKPACQRARKAGNNRSFAERNPDYWQGEYHVERTRRWRREHPGYWRREKRNGGPGREGTGRRAAQSGFALQADLFSQAVENKVVPLRKELAALQAVFQRYHLIIQGLASHLTGSALQAELGSILNAWYDRGSRVGPPPPACSQPDNKEPNSDEDTATSKTGPVPPGAGELQLGRSPPGP